jgi:hypothetical protein
MNNVIRVLEQMANDSSFQNEQAVEALITAAEINAEQSAAIITKDINSLERQLDICPDFVCAMFPAEDDESNKENEEEDKEENSVVNG